MAACPEEVKALVTYGCYEICITYQIRTGETRVEYGDRTIQTTCGSLEEAIAHAMVFMI